MVPKQVSRCRATERNPGTLPRAASRSKLSGGREGRQDGCRVRLVNPGGREGRMDGQRGGEMSSKTGEPWKYVCGPQEDVRETGNPGSLPWAASGSK